MKFHQTLLLAAATAACACATADTSAFTGARRNLTPHWKAGKTPAEIKAISTVNLPGMRTSYSGFFTVNASVNAELFFWYWPSAYPSQTNITVAWFQGGPGGSSLFGAFCEVGVARLSDDLSPIPNIGSWCDEYGCVFVDNPRNTGYSIGDVYCTDATCYGNDGASFFAQFMTAFGLLGNNNELYITGESYGGHYVPQIATQIFENNQNGGLDGVVVPLKGIAVGNGFSDPITMVQGYPDLMVNSGLIDAYTQRPIAEAYVANITAAYNSGDLVGAYRIWDLMINGDTSEYGAWFQNVTGMTDYFDFDEIGTPVEFGYPSLYVTQPFVRAAIGVGDAPFQDGNLQVEIALEADVMASQKSNLATLLNGGVKVLIYNGILDIICGAPLTDLYVPTIPWSGQAGYNTAGRTIWHDVSTGNVAGWVRGYSNLLRVTIHGAGHIAPYNQPVRLQDMIQRFINGAEWN